MKKTLNQVLWMLRYHDLFDFYVEAQKESF